MAQGGVVMDKSPSPPKMEWPENNATLSEPLNGSLTEQLQRIIIRKTVNGTSEGKENGQALVNASSGTDIKKLIKERDDMWREHARNQISFIQSEHTNMLKSLHDEIERLQQKCADVTQQFADKEAIVQEEKVRAVSSSMVQNLKNKLAATRADLTRLHDLSDRKDLKILSLEQRWNELEEHYKNDIHSKTQKLKELSAELAQKTATVAQLTNQLHQFRLKEAVEKQKQEQLVRQTDQPLRFLRANGTIVTNNNSENSQMNIEINHDSSKSKPPGNPPRKNRPGFRLGTVVVTTESLPIQSSNRPRSSILPPISASSTNSLVSTSMNIEKPLTTTNKQATITTKTTFRSSLKRVQSTNERQKSEQ